MAPSPGAPSGAGPGSTGPNSPGPSAPGGSATGTGTPPGGSIDTGFRSNLNWDSTESGEGKTYVVFCSNFHDKASMSDPHREAMSSFLNLLNNPKVFQTTRGRKIVWETACVGDKGNYKAPRNGRKALTGLYERHVKEDIKIALHVLDFRGRELKSYYKAPQTNAFLKELIELSENNDKLYQMNLKANPPAKEKGPAPAGGKKDV